MPIWRNRFIPHIGTKIVPHYDLNAFKHTLTMATTKGKIDTATAIEHIHKASTLAARGQHKEAAKFIGQVHRELGIEESHTFQ